MRALMPEDGGAARAFVSEQFTEVRYRARALELLDSALQFEDPEYVALLAFSEYEARLLGIVLFGTVAGARAVVKVHGVLASKREPRVESSSMNYELVPAYLNYTH